VGAVVEGFGKTEIVEVVPFAVEEKRSPVPVAS
jgi:hypothetical protein